MNNEQLQEIVRRLDSLTLEILGPLRSSKTLNLTALQQFDLALSELEKVLSTEELVSKKLVGNLWFVFTSMLTEAEYAKDQRGKIETAAWEIEDKLRRVFGPHF